MNQDEVLLSVVIPCYNEATIVEHTSVVLTNYLSEQDWNRGLEPKTWEIIFVNDGSSDNTSAVLEKLRQRDGRIRSCGYATNGGQGKALQAGFEAARGQWIICFDADLDYGPEHIETFLGIAIAKNADMVVGSPYCKGGRVEHVPKMRELMSRAMNWYFSHIIPVKLTTFTGILRLYRRSAVRKIFLISHDKDVLSEIIIKANLLKQHVVECPACLIWGKNYDKSKRKSAGIFSTAKKARQHFLVGLLENPTFFIFWPLLLSTLATIWFAVAITFLFFNHFQSGAYGLVNDITNTFTVIYSRSSHTFLFLIMSLQISLFLFGIWIVIRQNKSKKDHDFIMMCELLERTRHREKDNE